MVIQDAILNFKKKKSVACKDFIIIIIIRINNAIIN